MSAHKGLTIIEILIVLVIIGILAAIAIPYYTSSIWQTNVQAIENNMRAIGAAEQKYSEDYNGVYCSAATIPAASSCDNFSDISTNLHLNLYKLDNLNEGFVYTCAASGTCSAISPTYPSAAGYAVCVDANGKVTCNNTNACGANSCPN